MRRRFLLLPMLVLAAASHAQTSFQFGLTVNPLLSWLKPEASEIEKDKIAGGLEYGLMMDINFTENYILATGMSVTIANGNLVYKDSILQKLNNDIRFAGDTKAEFNLHYVNLPTVFKMRTNEMGIFRYFGGIGLVQSFRFKARVDAEANGTEIFDNENIVKNNDQTGGVFQSVVYNLSLHVEGGIEFPFSEKTALVAGIFYRNGFVNVLKDGDEDKVSLNNLGLRIGVLF